MPPLPLQSQCSCGNDERSRRVLMVRRLHPAVTMQMLLQTFGAFGSVTGCKVFTHKSGRSAGCASLEFSTHQAACAALHGLQGTLLHGKHIMLQWFDQNMSSTPSPIGRGPGQVSELSAGGILSEGGNAVGPRHPSSAAASTGALRSAVSSCPGLSPFEMLAAAAAATPSTHPFCNSAAAMAAAAAAAAAVAAHHQQQLQTPNEAATAAAALLAGQHHLPPLVVQQLQRQVSAPLSAFGQLSPTHVPPSPVTPGSHGGGWESLVSPVGQQAQQSFATVKQNQAQQQQQQQHCDAAASSSLLSGSEQHQQGWPAAVLDSSAALAAVMGSSSFEGSCQEGIDMVASLQHLASLQQHALVYAAWQNQQQTAAALLQHQLSGQLAASSLLSGHAHAQQAHMHLLGARSMPTDLSSNVSADLLLQQASANLQAQQHKSGLLGAEDSRSCSTAGNLCRQHSTPAPSANAVTSDAQQVGSDGSSSAGGAADSNPGAGMGSSGDQAAGCAHDRALGGCFRRNAGVSNWVSESPHNKPCTLANDSLNTKKLLQWAGQRQQAGDQASNDSHVSTAPPAFGKGVSHMGDSGRANGRTSAHQLLAGRGYTGSDDIASVHPDVDVHAAPLTAAQQQQASTAQTNAAVSKPYTSRFNQQAMRAQQLDVPASSAFQQGLTSESQGLMGCRPSAAGSFAQPGLLSLSPSLPGLCAGSAALSLTAASATGHQSQSQAPSSTPGEPARQKKDLNSSKRKTQLQLCVDDSNPASATGSRLSQLITTEVLPESPVASQQPQQAARAQPGMQGSLACAAQDSDGAWANWSASMVALLSPAHVSSLTGKRFEDLISSHHAHVAPPSTQQVHQVLGASCFSAASEGKQRSSPLSSSWLPSQHEGPEQPQQELEVGGCRAGSLLGCAGADMFVVGNSDGVSGSMLGKTRHNSLCLDSRPGLLTLSHMFEDTMQQQQISARPSPHSTWCSSTQQQQLPGTARALPGEPEPTSAPSGSFTFQPPVMRSLHSSNLTSGSGSSMISQPFQLPDFFSRGSRFNPSQRGSDSASGKLAPVHVDGAAEEPAGCVVAPVQPSDLQHQLSDNLSGMRLTEGSLSMGLDAAERAPGSPCRSRSLQHAFSMPARFSAPGGAKDALAAASASRNSAEQQHAEVPMLVPYDDVLKTIWGPNEVPGNQ